MTQILVALSGLMGACGVALAAAAAHAAPGAGLDSAAYLLMIHAAAMLGAAALLHAGLIWRPLGLAAALAFAIGGALFAGDISMRVFAGHPLFPMAAPSGGTLLIVAWLVMAAAAGIQAVRQR